MGKWPWSRKHEQPTEELTEAALANILADKQREKVLKNWGRINIITTELSTERQRADDILAERIRQAFGEK